MLGYVRYNSIFFILQTRMQSLAPAAVREGIGETFFRMIRTEGLLRPVRGISAMIVGAGPSHALYFSSYEYVKDTLKRTPGTSNHHIAIHGKYLLSVTSF